MSTKEFSILQIILGSHLWLGLSATVCTWGTFAMFHLTVSYFYLGFVLFGTMTIYNIHSLLSNREIRKQSPEPEGNIPDYLLSTIILGSITTIIMYLNLDRSDQLILLIPTCVSILYVFPFLYGKRLKDYPFIKIVAIMMAWTIVTFWIPVHSIGRWWEEMGYNYLFIDRMLFFFALAIPFDIRDIQYDREQNLKTIPNTIGTNYSQYLAIFSIVLAWGLMVVGSQHLNINPYLKFGILVIYSILGILIIRPKYLATPRYYGWFLDGILLLYGIVLLFLSR